MRIIPDTNQVEFIFLNTSAEGVSLAPYVLAELLLYSNPTPRLHLSTMPISLGLEPFHVMNLLSDMDEEKIMTFEPFYEFMLPNNEKCKEILGAITKPSQKHLKWARKVKDKNLKFCSELVGRSRGFRKGIRDMVAQGKLESVPKFNSSQQLINGICSSEVSFLGELIIASISNGGKKVCRVDNPMLLFNAVMGNQYLKVFFIVLICFLISFSQAWGNNLRRLNFEPSEKRDDWTDMTLPLYAKQGDCIITGDTKLKGIIAVAFSNHEVLVKTANELLAFRDVMMWPENGTNT